MVVCISLLENYSPCNSSFYCIALFLSLFPELYLIKKANMPLSKKTKKKKASMPGEGIKPMWSSRIQAIKNRAHYISFSSRELYQIWHFHFLISMNPTISRSVSRTHQTLLNSTHCSPLPLAESRPYHCKQASISITFLSYHNFLSQLVKVTSDLPNNYMYTNSLIFFTITLKFCSQTFYHYFLLKKKKNII